MQQARTSVAVDRNTVLDLHQIAVDLGRQEHRSLTLGDVIRRLIDAWQQRQPQAGA